MSYEIISLFTPIEQLTDEFELGYRYKITFPYFPEFLGFWTKNIVDGIREAKQYLVDMRDEVTTEFQAKPHTRRDAEHTLHSLKLNLNKVIIIPITVDYDEIVSEPEVESRNFIWAAHTASMGHLVRRRRWHGRLNMGRLDKSLVLRVDMKDGKEKSIGIKWEDNTADILAMDWEVYKSNYINRVTGDFHWALDQLNEGNKVARTVWYYSEHIVTGNEFEGKFFRENIANRDDIRKEYHLTPYDLKATDWYLWDYTEMTEIWSLINGSSSARIVKYS